MVAVTAGTMEALSSTLEDINNNATWDMSVTVDITLSTSLTLDSAPTTNTTTTTTRASIDQPAPMGLLSLYYLSDISRPS